MPTTLERHAVIRRDLEANEIEWLTLVEAACEIESGPRRTAIMRKIDRLSKMHLNEIKLRIRNI